MDKRTTIGLIYQYNENWIGGTYYIQNLIAALHSLSDECRPRLVVFVKEDKQYEDLAKTISYPYMSGRNLLKGNSTVQNINKLSKKIIKRKILKDYHTDIDVVFPASSEGRFKPGQKFLYWIPDFQEHYLPHFFTKEEIAGRKRYQSRLVENANYILFSSRSAQNDFNQIYPNNNVEQFVVPFAVTHADHKSNPTIYEKYKLPSSYFICCNQFWKHKNHIIVLEALALLRKQGKYVFVVFTGKEHDYRNPDFFDTLKQKVSALNLNNSVAFLGFISREDQIDLIEHSLAVVQPSLFEGWSTVVEDAKALHVNIIASDLAVHKEQLEYYEAKQLFNPTDANSLATCLQQVNSKDTFSYDYMQDVINFGKAFQQIFQRIVRG